MRVLAADIRDPAAVRAALGTGEYDVVADFVAYTPEHVQADVDLFTGRTGQYVFISSASTYQKPVARLPIVESTPLRNPIWPYSQAKIACEELLTRAYREDGFPVTIVRPSHTYDATMVPYDPGWTLVDRMRRGKPVVVHGDGTSLWTLTHHVDFAKGFLGLLGNPQAIGDAFHITSDEVLTWNQIHHMLAAAAGAEADIVHVPSDAILAHDEEWGRSLLGDKAHSVIFDNAKLRAVVPGLRGHDPLLAGRARDRRLARRGSRPPGGRRARRRPAGPAGRRLPLTALPGADLHPRRGLARSDRRAAPAPFATARQRRTAC